jgi:hypothetical protein
MASYKVKIHGIKVTREVVRYYVPSNAKEGEVIVFEQRYMPLMETAKLPLAHATLTMRPARNPHL